jgi:tetratricopeptide (TPR) repeat protein
MFDDGSEPNPDIRIERVCGGNTRLEGHVDSKGRFSFQLGGNRTVDLSTADASDSTPGFGGGAQPDRSFGGNSIGSSGRGGSGETALWGCELSASYPGYRSDVVQLGNRRTLDDPNVGTLILHHLMNVQGTTISVTTAEAPKAAQKNYEKGMQAAQKGKFDEAEKHLTEATGAFPKYAVAWFALGQVQQRQNKADEARKAYEKAVDADKKYVSPYDQLALLAAQQGKWQDAADFSKQAITLNPVEFPSSFWYNAIANYNLQHEAEAAKSAQTLEKLDTRHKYPEINKMLAEMEMNKKNYSDAAAHLRTYLQLAPNAKDADSLKQQLLKIEEANAAEKK